MAVLVRAAGTALLSTVHSGTGCHAGNRGDAGRGGQQVAPGVVQSHTCGVLRWDGGGLCVCVWTTISVCIWVLDTCQCGGTHMPRSQGVPAVWVRDVPCCAMPRCAMWQSQAGGRRAVAEEAPSFLLLPSHPSSIISPSLSCILPAWTGSGPAPQWDPQGGRVRDPVVGTLFLLGPRSPPPATPITLDPTAVPRRLPHGPHSTAPRGTAWHGGGGQPSTVPM